jgi:molybdopterin/thiamine biosynthesis adenylyltransferase
MTRYTLSLLEAHAQQLQRAVLRDDRERGALIICGRSRHADPWTGEIEERFLVREVIAVADEMYLERTPVGMTWSTTPFYRALKLAEPREFALAVLHSHPNGPLAFSAADDVAEKEIFEIAFNRLDSERPHLSIVMNGNGELVARAYGPDLKPHKVELIRIIGPRWKFRYDGRGNGRAPIELDRQVRAFGALSTADIAQLRFGIAGGGGTGSAVASLLPRIGARHLAFFDSDRVEETNLNRLHLAKRKDANLRRHKVDVLGEAVAELGLPISIARLPYPADDPRCRDALRACDVLFGCTDDHLGRNLLNRIAHFYLIPVIDLGLLIVPRPGGSGYETFDGRVTVVQPGYPCQVCRGLIVPGMMYAEALRRRDPALYEQRRRAGYIPDLSDPSPAVVTFTTEVATMAVNELFQRLNGFRGEDGHCSERIRRFDEVKDADSVPGGKSKPGCRLCERRRYDGRGDMTPFLDMTE